MYSINFWRHCSAAGKSYHFLPPVCTQSGRLISGSPQAIGGDTPHSSDPNNHVHKQTRNHGQEQAGKRSRKETQKFHLDASDPGTPLSSGLPPASNLLSSRSRSLRNRLLRDPPPRPAADTTFELHAPWATSSRAHPNDSTARSPAPAGLAPTCLGAAARPRPGGSRGRGSHRRGTRAEPNQAPWTCGPGAPTRTPGSVASGRHFLHEAAPLLGRRPARDSPPQAAGCAGAFSSEGPPSGPARSLGGAPLASPTEPGLLPEPLRAPAAGSQAVGQMQTIRLLAGRGWRSKDKIPCSLPASQVSFIKRASHYNYKYCPILDSWRLG